MFGGRSTSYSIVSYADPCPFGNLHLKTNTVVLRAAIAYQGIKCRISYLSAVIVNVSSIERRGLFDTWGECGRSVPISCDLFK